LIPFKRTTGVEYSIIKSVLKKWPPKKILFLEEIGFLNLMALPNPMPLSLSRCKEGARATIKDCPYMDRDFS